MRITMSIMIILFILIPDQTYGAEDLGRWKHYERGTPHKASVVKLFITEAGFMFVYDKPRSEMQTRGVKAGTVLFFGDIDQNYRLSGTAYLFTKNDNCRRLPYEVKGKLNSDKSRIILSGPSPRIPGSCDPNTYRYRDNPADELIFERITPSPTCFLNNKCPVLWTPAGEPGYSLSSFKKPVKRIQVSDIRVHSVFSSAERIKIYEKPHQNSREYFTIGKDTKIKVQGLRQTINNDGDPQLWLQISLYPEAQDFGYSFNSQTAKRVIDCYHDARYGENSSVSYIEMRQCSGGWVTPRILMNCLMEARCELLPDTIQGRAKLNTVLEQLKLTPTDPLRISSTTLPTLPTSQAIGQCKASSSDEDEFIDCISNTIADRHKSFTDCFQSTTESSNVHCIASTIKDPNFTSLLACMRDGKPSIGELFGCLGSEQEANKMQMIRSCMNDANSNGDWVSCLSSQLTERDSRIVECVAEVDSVAAAIECLDEVSPEMETARQVIVCLKQLNAEENNSELIDCLSPKLDKDISQLVECLQLNDTIATSACLLGDIPEVRIVHQAYNCLAGGSDASDIIANCSGNLFDNRTRETMACAARSGGDMTNLASCAAATILPKEMARLVGCSATSDGPTSFAICAVEPAVNEEWRIAAECAVQSGGEPNSFAICTAGRLTFRELAKCFTGQVGKDCFGPNNTIVKTARNAFKDLTEGPGENNEIVVFLRNLGIKTGGAKSIIQNPISPTSAVLSNVAEKLTGSRDSVAGHLLNPARGLKALASSIF